jgi:hypothetical protein
MPGVVLIVPLQGCPPRFRLIRAVVAYAQIQFALWRLRRAMWIAGRR